MLARARPALPVPTARAQPGAPADALLFGSLGEAPGLGPVESAQQSVDPAFLSVDAATLPASVTLTSSTRTATTLDVVLVSSGDETFTMQLAYEDGLVGAGSP